jgi:DNA-binding sugar fermentation-stimulating protein
LHEASDFGAWKHPNTFFVPIQKKGQKISLHVLNPGSLLRLLRFRFTIQEAQGATQGP